MKRFAAVVMLFLYAFCASAQVPAGLEMYAGKDLRKLNKQALGTFQKRVEALTGDKPKATNSRGFEAWWVKPFTGGSAAWVYLEAYPGYDIPDVSGIQVHVFDRNWKRFIKQSFPTGYRFFLKEVTVIKDSPLQQDVLMAMVTSAGPFIGGDKKTPAFEQGEFQRQYYAVIGQHLFMVRLEDNTGALVQNHYRWQDPPKGPPVPRRTSDQWIRGLRSTNPAEQLATLVWLSGEHLPSSETRKENFNQESVADSKLYESVRNSEETKKALKELANSRNPWVKEYAQFTLQAMAQ